MPAVGAYISKVIITYESTSTEGLEQYEAGQADFADFFPSDTSSILQLQSEGSIGVFYNPTISSFFLPFDLNFSLTAEAAIDPNAGELNVKGNFFASNTVRDLLVHAYPYTTIVNTVWTVDGVSYGHNFGGAIPIGMGNYYPNNVTFPYLGGNPCSGSTQSTCNNSVNSALWWWTEGTTVGTPYYDSELAACTTSSPCSFPIIGELGNPGLDAAIVDFIQQLGIITNNAIVPYSFDLSFPDLVEYSAVGGGNNPMPFYNLGWAPDYPDPTDYMAAMYYANGTYTYGDGTYQVLEAQAEYNQAGCDHNSGSWSDLVYWANYPTAGGTGDPIPNGCQGPAYGAMLTWMSIAASQAPGAYRVLIYNEVEQIENQLSFYLWYEEANGVGSSAKWINNATINTNVMIGGGGDQTFYLWQYTTAVANVYFNETGLTSTNWTVTMAGVTHYSDGTATVQFSGVANGTYPYHVGYSEGYSVSPTNGTVTVVAPNAAGFTTAVTFTAFPSGGTCSPLHAGYPQATCGSLAVSSQGLITGTSWTVLVTGVGTLTSTSADPIFLGLPAASYAYTALGSIGYTISSGATASVAVSAGATTSALVTYAGISFTTEPITLNATGLTAGSTWSVNLSEELVSPTGGVLLTNTTISGNTGTIVFWEVNNTYYFLVSTTSTETPISPVGQANVNGPLNITVPFTAAAETLTFTESGFPAGSGVPWGVTVAATPNPAGGATDGFTVPSSSSSLTFNVSAGLYNYSAIPLQGWFSPNPTGNVTVTSSGGSALIRYIMVVYAQTFYEVNLPPASTWSVNATFAYPDTTVTSYVVVASVSDTLAIPLPNGTAPYVVTGSLGYTAKPGTLVVSAATGFAIVVFSIVPSTYTVTFSQTGVPTGATWSVWANGMNYPGSGASINFQEQNGTYTYVVTVPSGYTATPAGGSFNVTGAAASVTLSVAPTPSTTSSSSSGLSTLAYELIGLFVALAVIFLITTLYFARRRPPATNPPQSWQGSEGTEGSSSTTSTDGVDGQLVEPAHELSRERVPGTNPFLPLSFLSERSRLSRLE